MARVIEVVYENGVFKPLEKVDLPEKIKGKVIVEEKLMGDVKEFIEKVGEILKDIKINEDPLEVLLEMRKRPWD